MFFFLFSDDVCMIMKFLSNSPICHMTANTFPQLPNPSVVTLTANQHFAVNRWNTNYSGMKQKQNFKYILLHFLRFFFLHSVYFFHSKRVLDVILQVHNVQKVSFVYCFIKVFELKFYVSIGV